MSIAARTNAVALQKQLGTEFDIDIKRYTLLKSAGKGAFGTVVAAKDSQSGDTVAIKKILRVFENSTAAKRVLREIKFMRHMRHPNLIRARDFPIPQSILDPNRATSAASLPQPSHPVLPAGMPPTPVTQQDLESLYLVSDFMDADLHSVITSSQPLGDKYLQYFILQMMRGLAHMHACNVLHRDMKPTNLLVKKNCELMICDLGLARVDREISIEDPSVCMTEHVVTRWYRAPEVILSWGRYTKAIDVWSAGCIMAEILGRTPIFPGKNYIHQLELITDCIGKPTEEEIAMFENEKARKFLRSLPAKKPTPLLKTYPTANPLGLDLLSKMLMFDPSKRITAEEALSHPYLVAAAHEYPAPTVGPHFQSPTKLFHDFEDSSEYVGRDVVCALLWLELTEFHLQENENKPDRLPSIMQPAARFLLSTSMSPTSQAGLAALSPAIRISPVARIDTSDKVHDKSADHSSSDMPFSPSGRRVGTSFADAVRSPPPIKSPAARIQPVESAPITTSVARAAPAPSTTSLSKAPAASAASARALPTATQDAYGVRGVPTTSRVRPAPLPHSISAAAMSVPSYMRPKESSLPASQLSARARVDALSQATSSRLPPTARPAGLPLKR